MDTDPWLSPDRYQHGYDQTPKLIPQCCSLVFVLALLASLGGLALFGHLGVIYGPVIMVPYVGLGLQGRVIFMIKYHYILM